MKKLLQLSAFVLLSLLFMQCDPSESPEPTPTETVTDIDGNVYNTIIIGNQTWMLENLETKTLNDGTPLTEHVNGMDWGSLPDRLPQWQWADTSDLNNVVDEELPVDYYGAMYNHWAIESGMLAPEGWRIPTEADFIELENYLSNNGFSGNVATALKSSSGWLPQSGNGTNAVGFNGLPNGYVNAFGGPTLGNGICTWATSDVSDDTSLDAQTRRMAQLFNEPTISYANNSTRIGSGVRCIKNN